MALDGQHVRKVNEKDGFFDATSCLDKIQQYVERFDSTKQRVLQSVDLFGGHGNFAKVCRSKGKSCEGIDVLYDPEKHNILSELGFFHILNILLAVASRMFIHDFSFFYFTIVCFRCLKSLSLSPVSCYEPAHPRCASVWPCVAHPVGSLCSCLRACTNVHGCFHSVTKRSGKFGLQTS